MKEKIMREKLLIEFEIKRRLYSHFIIESISKDRYGFTLKASVRGENFDPRKHVQRISVKAVTYHEMEVLKEPGRYTLKFILDI